MSKILVALDFSDVSKKVVEEAVRYAKMSDSEVVLMHSEPPNQGYMCFENSVVPTIGLGNGETCFWRYEIDAQEDAEKKAEKDLQILESYTKMLDESGVRSSTVVIAGDAAHEIASAAVELGTHMIVVGNHRHGKFYKLIFDDISTSLVQEAPCPVLIVPADK